MTLEKDPQMTIRINYFRTTSMQAFFLHIHQTLVKRPYWYQVRKDKLSTVQYHLPQTKILQVWHLRKRWRRRQPCWSPTQI